MNIKAVYILKVCKNIFTSLCSYFCDKISQILIN